MKAKHNTSAIVLSILMGLTMPVGASVVDILNRDFEDGLVGASAISTPGSNTWVNIRPSTDASNGGVPARATFDGFFNSRFMIIGDLDGSITDSNNGTSIVSFALNLPSALTSLSIAYDWVFDTNNAAGVPSPDLFSVEFLVGSTLHSYLQGSDTTLTPDRPLLVSTTRGNFSLTLTGASLNGVLAAGVDQIRFRLRESTAPNSSAVGIDNLLISGTVPAPATWLLVAIGFACGGYARRLACR
jgi:hypothetical protein